MTKRNAFWVSTLVIGYGLFELTALFGNLVAARFNLHYWPIHPTTLLPAEHAGLKALCGNDPDSYARADDHLGWTTRERSRSRNGLYQGNADGIRSDHEYSRIPGAVLRLATFGDSFTFGHEVALESTWQRLIERSSQNWEVLNFGVSGYGPDQAYLRYLSRGASFRPHIAVMGFMSENINRVVNVFRPYYTPNSELATSKPRFFLEGRELRLAPSPIQTKRDCLRLLEDPASLIPHLSRGDYWYHTRPHASEWDRLPSVRLIKNGLFWFNSRLSPTAILTRNGVYREGTEALEISKAILTAFSDSAIARNSLPLVILFPTADDISRRRTTGSNRYAPLVEHLESEGIRYLDLFDGFQAYGAHLSSSEIFKEQHYSEQAHAIVATTLKEYLQREGLNRVEAIIPIVKLEHARQLARDRIFAWGQP